MVTAYIVSSGRSRNSATLEFPTTGEKLAEKLEKRQIQPGKCRVGGIFCDNASLFTGLPPADLFSLDDVQYIASKYEGMSQEERDTFLAVMELEFGDDPKQKIFDGIQNLKQCGLDKTIQTEEGFGLAWLDAGRARVDEILQKLSASSKPAEKNLADYINTLEQHFDVAAYGREQMDINDHYLTSRGILSINWQEFYLSEDLAVPEEYRLNLDAGKKPSVLTRLEEEKAGLDAKPVPERPAKQSPER